MSNVERTIQQWRSELLIADISLEDVDELESHLFDTYTVLKKNYDDDTALSMAFDKMGDPRDAWRSSSNLPHSAVVAVIYVWLFGIAWVLNEVLLLANGVFDVMAAAVGIFFCYCAFRISQRSRKWLNLWLGVSWLVLISLALACFSLLLYTLVTLDARYIWYLIFNLTAFFVSIWQLRVFYRPAVQILY